PWRRWENEKYKENRKTPDGLQQNIVHTLYGADKTTDKSAPLQTCQQLNNGIIYLEPKRRRKWKEKE
ncbi:MAG: hypothetical protein ACP5QD_03375, partial [Candidatus Ratteibacteria bacterium]